MHLYIPLHLEPVSTISTNQRPRLKLFHGIRVIVEKIKSLSLLK
jgi:hypothetical protein